MGRRYEHFEENNANNGSVLVQGEYKRNNKKCDATVVYRGSSSDYQPSFCIIEKKDSPWDSKKEKTYSTGWKCSSGYYVLGLPTQKDDIMALKNIVDRLAGEFIGSEN